jgi:hypothetical protein
LYFHAIVLQFERVPDVGMSSIEKLYCLLSHLAVYVLSEATLNHANIVPSSAIT